MSGASIFRCFCTPVKQPFPTVRIASILNLHHNFLKYIKDLFLNILEPRQADIRAQ